MFKHKNVLVHKNNKNPYGLVNKYGQDLSRSETISYFTQIHLTDEELLELNSYIKENKNHTFYDNAYMVYDGSGYPADFIFGLRCMNELINKETPNDIKLNYTLDNQTYEVTISRIFRYKGYIRFEIICNGNIFKTYMGYADNDSELWICFPHIDKSTVLYSLQDTVWNENELYRLLQNKTDAILIAYAITYLKDELELFELE